MKIIADFIVSFFALFVAIDAVGLAPVFLSLTHESTLKEKKSAAHNAIVAASVLAAAFILLGTLVFRIMGITIEDFKIAGGIVLLILSIRFLLGLTDPKRTGTPLLVGPAVLTMLLILRDARGLIVTVLAFALNMALAEAVFLRADKILTALGASGVKAASKIVDILLCAFAVKLIREGIQHFAG